MFKKLKTTWTGAVLVVALVFAGGTVAWQVAGAASTASDAAAQIGVDLDNVFSQDEFQQLVIFLGGVSDRIAILEGWRTGVISWMSDMDIWKGAVEAWRTATDTRLKSLEDRLSAWDYLPNGMHTGDNDSCKAVLNDAVAKNMGAEGFGKFGQDGNKMLPSCGTNCVAFKSMEHSNGSNLGYGKCWYILHEGKDASTMQFSDCRRRCLQRGGTVPGLAEWRTLFAGDDGVNRPIDNNGGSEHKKGAYWLDETYYNNPTGVATFIVDAGSGVISPKDTNTPEFRCICTF